MPSIATMKRRIRLTTLVLLSLICVAQVNSETEPKSGKAAQSAKSVVVLTIDYGDGAQKRFPAIPWQKEMTVLSALEWAAKHPRGVDFDGRGKKSTTLITKIDDLKNGGADNKNWVFRVNDKLGDRSCGVFALKPADRILWKYERYE